jgi:oxygen-independent coproporphyrinogen-3 oxidase
MLEVDDDSRLGRELIAGGTRYHAHFVPNDDATADFYVEACDLLDQSNVRQYEISNFATEESANDSPHGGSKSLPHKSWQSRHNLKYWTRQPYLGFGVDAHSMLLANPLAFPPLANPDDAQPGFESVRFSNPDILEQYLANNNAPEVRRLGAAEALEEAWFLGLRLNRGVRPQEILDRYGPSAAIAFQEVEADLIETELLEKVVGTLRLTRRGRLLSNEVFERFLVQTSRLQPKVDNSR